ncbi:HAD family hydrolase [Evansella tamaricis]|uniref:HAD family hydrolase n=1 Tax=Evansella tamaricis TaxID=2069301 RepID=A0ABS6JKT4_9BACI|nr:HAD family hydrolase [Evansella tamaricis]MBU9713814.1 HAD family hydrolase [Evansella tamaricis]
MEKKKAVFFDLDDTLYDQLLPFKKAVVPYLEQPDNGFIEKLFKTVRYYSDLLWMEHTKGRLALHQLRIQRLIKAFLEYGIILTDNDATDIQNTYLQNQKLIEPFDGVYPLIETLQEQNFFVGMITNGPVEHQVNKIKQLGLLNVIPMKYIFVSDAVGIAKPDKNIFLHVNKVTGKIPSNCYYVGDSWTNDVIPASEAGWTSIWYNYRNRNPLSKFTDYRELKSYTNGMNLFL